MAVVEEAANGHEVLEKLATTEVDVVILDLDIGKPTGIEITEIIGEKYPEVKVLILSMIGLHDFVIQALETGATGYILKNTGKDEVINCHQECGQG